MVFNLFMGTLRFRGDSLSYGEGSSDWTANLWCSEAPMLMSNRPTPLPLFYTLKCLPTTLKKKKVLRITNIYVMLGVALLLAKRGQSTYKKSNQACTFPCVIWVKLGLKPITHLQCHYNCCFCD